MLAKAAGAAGVRASDELRLFIYRAQVVSLYRTFLRQLRDVSQPARGEMHAEIRRQFDAARQERDVYRVKYQLSDGRQRLKQLKDMLGLKA